MAHADAKYPSRTLRSPGGRETPAAKTGGEPRPATPEQARRSLWQRIREPFVRGNRRDDAPEPEAFDGPPGGMPESLRREIQRALPAGQPLAQWTDARPIEEELPRARVAMDRGEKALATMFSDVRRGRVPQVDQVSDAMAGVADSMIENPDALLWVAHLRDKHTRSYRHAMRVALYMVALGRGLGFPRNQLASLGSVGLLADIGKTRVPQALLDKPSTLTPEEFEKAKLHVSLGHEMLAASGRLPGDVLGGIFQHHERLDGSGYPRGLKGDEIGLYGKMAAIADCFTALSARRAYADPLAPQDALMSLYQWADTSFHGALVEQFVRAIGVFPVGSLVELSTGAVAVVVANQRVRRLQPRVLLLTGPDKRQLAAPLEVDLLQRPREEQSESLRIVRALPAGAYGLVLRDYYGDGSVAAA